MNNKTAPQGLQKVSTKEIDKIIAKNKKAFDEFEEWLNTLPFEEREIAERELHRFLIDINSFKPLKD